MSQYELFQVIGQIICAILFHYGGYYRGQTKILRQLNREAAERIMKMVNEMENS